jgi:hypothetical protein
MSTTEDTDDVDSGWDVPDDEPAPSLSPRSEDSAALDAATDELDAGWDDVEPSDAPGAPLAEAPQSRERQRGKAAADARRPSIVKPAPSRQPSAKKLERAMSRKHREREASAKAKREQERKAQRRAEQAKRAERTEELRAAEASKRRERGNTQSKPRTEPGPKAKPAARRDVERREHLRREPADPARKSVRKAKEKAAARGQRRRIVGGALALLALGVLAFVAWMLGR